MRSRGWSSKSTQHELLPGAGQEPAVLDGHGLGRADDRGLQVRVGVRVALHLVVVVVGVRRDEPVHQLLQVLHAARLVLDQR